MFTNTHAKVELYVIRINKAWKNPSFLGLYSGFKIRDFEKIKRNYQQIYVKIRSGFIAMHGLPNFEKLT
jgi:hypothetical protein